jgi:hypothetical protein
VSDPTSPEDPHTSDLEVPVPRSAPPRRSPRLTAAAGVLLLTGVLDVVGFALVISSSHDATGGIQRGFVRGEAIALLALAAMNALAGLLVLRLRPNGRTLGLFVGAVGVLIGLASLGSSPAQGLPTLVIAGFVVWVLATEGSAFRPPDGG